MSRTKKTTNDNRLESSMLYEKVGLLTSGSNMVLQTPWLPKK
jgi:hypothetical protein